MIARIDIDKTDRGECDYSVSIEGEVLYADDGLPSMTDALVGAVEGLPPEVMAAEIALRGIVSGTYPLGVLALNPEQIAEHAENTTAAVEEALAGR